MIISFEFDGILYSSDLKKGKDISIPLISDATGPKCFFAPNFKIEPVVAGDFIGSVAAGSPVNFKNIFINPHGNGTHTECVGHISADPYTIHECLKEFHYVGRLVTLTPDVLPNGDQIITEQLLIGLLEGNVGTEVIIIRTLPNEETKTTVDYSGKNPPYFTTEAIQYLHKIGVHHLITDLPSIDREEDGGRLDGHKTFWGYPDHITDFKTITEMVYVPNDIEDGLYFCNIQITSIMSDASPSKIVLYEMER